MNIMRDHQQQQQQQQVNHYHTVNNGNHHHGQQQQQQQQHQHQHNGGNKPNNATEAVNSSQTHLTKFAFLLSSARGENSDEPVVGMHHDVEMAMCFSKRHLCPQQQQMMNANGSMMMNNMMQMQQQPPSISSSSLSMQNNGQQQSNYGKNKNSLLQMAAMNMSAPFYTTPDTVSSTAKTVLKNIVATMEELMDSRLRSTVSQLVRKAGGITNSQLLFRLLSPSRNPIQVATVITRFVLPDGENVENMGSSKHSSTTTSSTGADGQMMLSIPLQFKAILDVKVFGEVSTVELSAPVTMSGKFDPNDGLLTAVDVSFDCANLLQTMIGQARLVVKTTVTKAAALSVQIAEWNLKKKASSLGGSNLGNNTAASSLSLPSLSLHSLLGSSMSLNSLTGLGDGSTALGSIFTSFSSMSNAKQKKVMSKSCLLRNFSRNNTNAGMAAAQNKTRLGNYSRSNNANATFDFGNNHSNTNGNNIQGVTLGNRTANTGSVVRFRMPSPTSSQKRLSSMSGSTESSALPNNHCQQPHQQQQQQVVALHQQHRASQQQDEEASQQNKGNIHAGLFSWLQDESMFLTDEKIQEQNDADAERERKLRDAPMPLRFFTAAEDMGGGECGLEMVSKSIFGGMAASSGNNNNDQQEKRRQDGQGQQQCHQKRRKVW